ncbi:MAG: DUF2088 domain-containing protein [Treponema sp.]|nr:DUF2088 domain-containing protein [Treponema sp.]
MSIFDQLLAHIAIPKFIKVHYNIQQSHLEQPDEATHQAIIDSTAFKIIAPNDSVCIACGSREIAHIKQIVQAVVSQVKTHHGNPFIVPAMGSHGGATASGQKQILETFGLDETGAPIRATMETEELGKTPDGLAVRIDKYAASADVIIIVGRIKPHTDFRGQVESGLTKMLAVGLGKQYGASVCHSMGFENMAANIKSIAEVIIEKKQKIIGIGIIENCFHETYKIAVLHGAQIPFEEPSLLVEAKSLMPKIPFKKCDTLFIDEIGKNISGAGMDPNITGRSAFLGKSEPFFDSIAVLDLTAESCHNGNGIGNADVTTERFFKKFSYEMTYPNSITCLDSSSVKLPAVMPNDYLAMKFALNLAYLQDIKIGPKVVWLHNTLHMHSFFISENLAHETQAIPALHIASNAQEVLFDKNGNVIPFDWS